MKRLAKVNAGCATNSTPRGKFSASFLPTGARYVPGLDLAAAYVPARELGGDFYDFLSVWAGRLGVALGDVSGKGTAAALYGSLAIGTVRELVADHAVRSRLHVGSV